MDGKDVRRIESSTQFRHAFRGQKQSATGFYSGQHVPWRGLAMPLIAPRSTLGDCFLLRSSYMFVFRVQSEPALTREVVQHELLVYYRGLSGAVLKRRNVTVDPSQFALVLRKVKTTAAAGETTDSGGRERYEGDLEWVEPFVTRRPQTLHLEVDVWASSKTSDRFLFACVSPQDKQAAIWKTMHELRATFLEANP